MRRDTAGVSAGVGETGAAAGAETRNTRHSFGILRSAAARTAEDVSSKGLRETYSCVQMWRAAGQEWLHAPLGKWESHRVLLSQLRQW